jgi:hypothetical protein
MNDSVKLLIVRPGQPLTFETKSVERAAFLAEAREVLDGYVDVIRDPGGLVGVDAWISDDGLLRCKSDPDPYGPFSPSMKFRSFMTDELIVCGPIVFTGRADLGSGTDVASLTPTQRDHLIRAAEAVRSQGAYCDLFGNGFHPATRDQIDFNRPMVSVFSWPESAPSEGG